MKTAEEILDKFEGSKEYPQLVTRHEAEEAMKVYGRQCAEQALKDAAEHFDLEANRSVILSTPIVTP